MAATHPPVLRALLLFGALLLALLAVQPARANGGTPCVDGTAAGFACRNVTLLAQLPVDALGGSVADGNLASDLWGWRDAASGREFIAIGLRDATSFVEVSDPTAPRYVGKLPAPQPGVRSNYRDIKVYQHYAYIVGDVPYTAHGMQVFDLTRLLAVAPDAAPVVFDADAHYAGVAYAHNLWINAATGYAYIFRSDQCAGGTHIVDIRTPLQPTLAGAGCLIVDGADSDAECLIYNGPDADYRGREICFIGSDSSAGIGDVSNKANPRVIANFAYPNIHRAHQGVLSADHRLWYLSDTEDEMMGGVATNTVIIDVSDLDNPRFVRRQAYSTAASDHNIYLRGALALMTNWRAGLRVVDTTAADDWPEIAYFDTYAPDDAPGHLTGTWSHYDGLASGAIAVSDVQQGLFLLRLTLAPTDVALAAQSGTPIGTGWWPLLLLATGALGGALWRVRAAACAKRLAAGQ